MQRGENVKWSESPWSQTGTPVREEKAYGAYLPKIQVLSSKWKTVWVRENESGDCEDGEDDELHV